MLKSHIIKYIILLLCALPVFAYAQQGEKPSKHELQLTVGLDSYLAFQFEPSYSYMFHKNIGVTGGFRLIQEIVENLRYDFVSDPVPQWKVSNKKRVSILLFKPALRLKIPIVNDWVSFVTEPGLLINLIPNETLEFAYYYTKTTQYQTVKSKGGEAIFYNVKNYLSFQIDNWAILLGYDLSTHELYSGRRNIIIEGDALKNHLPRKIKFTHTGFVGVSFFL